MVQDLTTKIGPLEDVLKILWPDRVSLEIWVNLKLFDNFTCGKSTLHSNRKIQIDTKNLRTELQKTSFSNKQKMLMLTTTLVRRKIAW